MTSTTTTRDGTTLLVREWLPAEPAWLHLLLVHGIAEHSGRYERTGRLLAAHGVAVMAYDHRGHGGSEGRRGDAVWADLTHDCVTVLNDVRGRGRPAAMLGHSMGGLIALDAMASRAATPDLLVLSAPGLGDALPRWQHLAAPIAARFLPTLTVKNAWDGSVLSRDAEVAREAAADPLNLSGTTVRLGAGAFAAQDRMNAEIARWPRMPVPTLVLHGAADRLVPPAATEALGRLPGVERRTYPDLRHELLNEPEGPSIVADMVAWLRDQVAELPAGS